MTAHGENEEPVALGEDVRALFESGGLLVELFETAPFGWVLVEDGRIVWVNGGAERLFGWPRKEIVGQPIEVLVPGRFQGAHAGQRLAYEASPRARAMGELTVTAIRRDGTELPVDVQLSPVSFGGRRLVAAVVRDETEHQRSERRLLGLGRKLEQANGNLLERNRELEQFAFVASHDLKEPLRKIVAFGDRLEKRLAAHLDPEARNYLDRMKAAAGRMQALIDDLLSYSRLTTKAVPFAHVDLDALVAECVADLEITIDRVGGTVEVGALGTIDADPHQMRQLFQNLIENALKYRREGVPPLVRIVTRRTGAGADERLVVDIADNGIGFEPRHAERIFVLFERLHSHQQYEGTGLGLAICRKIVDRHGGRLSATGAPGVGATFHLELPISHANVPSEAP